MNDRILRSIFPPAQEALDPRPACQGAGRVTPGPDQCQARSEGRRQASGHISWMYGYLEYALGDSTLTPRPGANDMIAAVSISGSEPSRAQGRQDAAKRAAD